MVSTDANEDGAARGKAAPRPLDQGPGAQARRRRAGRAPPGSRGPATGVVHRSPAARLVPPATPGPSLALGRPSRQVNSSSGLLSSDSFSRGP